MSDIQEISFRDVSKLLTAMGTALGAKALRTAARDAMKPALEQVREGAPVANPPYGPYENPAAHKTRPFDPFPIKTYKGRLVTPGFTRRSIRMVASVQDGGNKVRVAIGVRKEAFEALSFLELGTSKMAKRPWLEPAFRYSVGEVDRVFQQRIKELIDKAAGL